MKFEEMIYNEIMILRKDVESIKEWQWKMAGVGVVVSILATVVFQVTLAFIQRGG